MEAASFDEEELFSTVARSGARVLLIGRRALVALGIPVLTADYDVWVHADDVAALNRALAPLDLAPNRSPEEDAWTRRESIPYAPGVSIAVPSIDDLILTKRWSLRPKDVDDIALLEKLKHRGGSAP